MWYPHSGYIMFSLRKLNFIDAGARDRITQTPKNIYFAFEYFLHKLHSLIR